MKSKIARLIGKVAGALFIPVCLMVASCTAEPDDSNRFSFTGETIEDFLANRDSAFSSFNYILTRSGYDRLLSTYGPYTCFAPNNEAVQEYIDSLYDDADARIPHNGMNEKSLEGLSDSLCTDIAEYHLLNQQEKLTSDFSASGTTLRTILGRQISTSIVDGQYVLGGGATIINADNELVNGVVHVLDKVIPRSNLLVNEEFIKSDKFTIFNQALELTGLSDSLEVSEKNLDISQTKPGATKGYYIPTACKKGFTVFAETDQVFNRNGIHSIDDLIAKCKEWYAQAASGSKNTSVTATQGWYDYYRDNNVEISTATDYTSEKNVLNMFVRYHILNASLGKDVLAFDNNIVNGNGYSGAVYGNSGDAIDYYETMLPKTLLKVWKVKKEGGTFYLNRYVENNTLTDQVESLGSESMHTVRFAGVKILADSVLSPTNGYIYPVDQVLLYNAQVPNGVLNERMRFDCLTLLPEIMNNGFRGMFIEDLQALSGNSSDGRIRFPVNYFDNIRVFNGTKTTLDMNVCSSSNAYLSYKGDTFQGMGVYDFAIKLPPVPNGTYELRVAATNFGADAGSMMQYYIGNSSDVNSMEAIDLPLDLRMSSSNPMNNQRVVEIGYIPLNDEENYPDAFADKGIASDKVMRQHGYMREALSITKTYSGTSPQDWIGRFKAYQFRRILIKRDFTQRDMWLRIKTVLPDETTRKFQIDYIEFCPVNIAESTKYMEDMY